MPSGNKCPQCGAALPAGALAGLCPACLLKQGAAADTAPPPGAAPFTPPTVAELAKLFPQIEILSLIGQGGMGAVYKARQKQLDRIVALKILPPAVSHDPKFAERFAREARALARLNHPNIVTLYEFGQADGLFYFLMEFMDGMNLRQLLNAGRVTPKEALAIVPPICDALQFAHDRGIVHRDIKPENILLSKEGQVKIADFGVAKIVASEPATTAASGTVAPLSSQTDAGLVMGTPQYMAPEQTEHPSEVDHRADIYSLGVVFYQMLTGELPKGKFEAPSKKVVIDVRLDEVVLRALEKEPERRYQQVSEVKTQVETIANTPAVVGVPASAGPQSPTPVPAQPQQPRVRLEIAGAGIASIFFLDLLFWIGAFCLPTAPAEPFTTLASLGLPFALLAPVITPLFGWLAVSKIRCSAGPDRGLGLAVFDGLLFPLLALDWVIGLLSVFSAGLVAGLRGLRGSLFDHMPELAAWLLLTIGLIAWLDYLIVRSVWRAVSKPLGSDRSPRVSATISPAGAQPAAATEEIRRQVKGPAIGLLVTGILNWILISAIALFMLYYLSSLSAVFGGTPSIVQLRSPETTVPLAAVPIAALVLSSLMIFSALKMKRLEGYGWAVAAAILAILVSPGNIIGLPLGIWALVVLARPEVRAAFRQSEKGGGVAPPSRLSAANAADAKAQTGGWWRVTLSVVAQVAAMVPLLAFATYIVPKSETLARDFGAGLPGATIRIVHAMHFLQGWSFWALVAAILLSWAMYRWGGRKLLWRWTVGVAAGLFALFVVTVAAVIIPILCYAPQVIQRNPARTEKTTTPPRVPPETTGGPAIAQVKVERNQVVIEGRGAPDAKFVFQVGKGSWNCNFLNDSPFTATIERAWWGGELIYDVRDSRGNVLSTIRGGRVGPMTEHQRGQIVFRKGTLSPESDNSYVIGEFRAETGQPFPISVRLETLSKQTVSPADAKPTPRLQFRLVAAANDTAPTDTLADPGSKEPLRIRKEVLLDESAVARASIVVSPERGVSVEVEFNEAGATRFAQITGANIGKRLAVVFDGKVLSAPTIMSVIHDKAVITGNFTAVEVAEAIANALNAAKAKPPLLGADLTQDVVKDLQLDGTIRFKTSVTQRNTGGESLKTLRFANSDFIHVDALMDAHGRAMSFAVKRTGKMTLNYEATLAEPVKPGAEYTYVMAGTETGLVKHLPQSGEFEYVMRHWPGSGRTRRIERHLLPVSARLLSKTPADLAERIRDSRVELFIDRLIPSGDSLEVRYTYRLPTKP
ncbi:MAG: protein kinase [Verrucomicrobia bacterium]|nr:protein kinase [Verrucomicrobiota bacterium]